MTRGIRALTSQVVLALIVVSALLGSSLCGWCESDVPDIHPDVNRQLQRLDRELANRKKYVERRSHFIDSLTARGKSLRGKEQLDNMLALGDAYSSFDADSAMSYYDRGSELALRSKDGKYRLLFKLRHAMYLPLMSLNSEAEAIMAGIRPEDVPSDLIVDYYDARRQMFFYISSYYTDYPAKYEEYIKAGLEAQAALIPLLEPGSPRYLLNQGECCLYNKEYAKASTLLKQVLEKVPVEHNYYARACYNLAELYRDRSNPETSLYYLTLSAIADTRGATREVVSLQNLGRMMYIRGDIDRAYSYLSQALANAVECNAPLRIMQSAQVYPYIEEAYKAELNRSSRNITIVMWVLGILIVVLGVTLFFLYRKNVQKNHISGRLEEANEIKDMYIRQFLNLCSVYMDKLSQFNKLVNSKISNGKVEDLYKITKSGRFIEEQSREFYDVFDDAFLHIFPTFVEEVNALLRPEERIVLPEGVKLNTDLRIVAFMRLGIEDSSRIAQMLNYSVYTIYTYRNKLKNRAIDRETFEQRVMNVKSLS